MDLQHLQNFLVIVEQGSISNAATLIRITQPALSRQVQALEAQVGSQLLDRKRRGVVLTPAGEALAYEARKVLASIRDAQNAVDAAAGRRGGRLSMGFSPSLARLAMPQIALKARSAMPDVHLSFVEGSVDELGARLADGSLDLAMLHYRTPMPKMNATPLFSESVVAVGAAGVFAPGDAVTMKGFLRQDSVLAASTGRLRLMYEKLAAKAGETASNFIQVDSFGGLIELIVIGGGVSLLPYSSVRREIELGLVSWADLSPAPLRRNVGLVWPENRVETPALDGLKDVTYQFVAQQAPELGWDLPDETTTRSDTYNSETSHA